MITLSNLSLRLGTKQLFSDINWTIYHKQRFGLVGANGTGKTTLLGILLKQIAIDSGELEIPKQLRFAYVAQETQSANCSALDYVLDGDKELRHLEHLIRLAEDAHDGMKIATLYEQFGNIDAYTAPARAAQLLSGLGFSTAQQQLPISDFSGGWRMRLNLAKALMAPSDILLLDEPTNHLDLDAVLWLEEWLRAYPGTLLMISHDRDFLDSTVNHIAHLEKGSLTAYTGNYSSYEQQYVMQKQMQQAAYTKQQQQVAHLQQFVDRFRAKASKAKQAQSRLKALERMEMVAAVHAESSFQFTFRTPSQCPNPLLNLDEMNVGYGDKIILKNVNLTISPSDRIAMLGPNGAGKSTLIKAIVGELKPMNGVFTQGSGIKIGYFAQHQIDYLDLDATPLLHMQRIAPRETDQQLRTFLGTFGFPGDQVFSSIKNFSGGEKSRLALAMIVWDKPNLLLLDEPTNHLDLEMREALSLALQEYTGAMILVSHDRFLVRTTTDQLYLVANQNVEPFEGDLQEYSTWLLNFRREQTRNENKNTEGSRKELRQKSAEARDRLKPLTHQIKKLEEALGKLQVKLDKLELKLADQKMYEDDNKEKLKQLLLDQAALQKEISSTEGEWLLACEERDNLTND